jgi:hypothetical protein
MLLDRYMSLQRRRGSRLTYLLMKKSIKAVIGALRKLCRRRPVDFFVSLGWGNREAMTRIDKSVITHFRSCRELICLY